MSGMTNYLKTIKRIFRESIDVALYRRFLRGMAVIAIIFFISAFVKWQLYPVAGLPVGWLWAGGAFCLLGLWACGEFMVRYYMLTPDMASERWYERWWGNTAIPLFVSVIVFFNALHPVGGFIPTKPPADSPLVLAAGHFVWIYFPTFILIVLLANILVERSKRAFMAEIRRMI